MASIDQPSENVSLGHSLSQLETLLTDLANCCCVSLPGSLLDFKQPATTKDEDARSLTTIIHTHVEHIQTMQSLVQTIHSEISHALNAAT